jgi:selenocysteine lyase/cysteine desulfurase
MGVETDNLAITKNTAHGVSIVADGLDWREGDEVIFADCEYPANTYPWLAQEARGIVSRVVPTHPDGTLDPGDYARLISPRTRMIAVSWVQFSTGFRSDLAALAEIAHSHRALLLVDVIQGLGAFPIDLGALGVDIAATGSQKWLLGPLGVGGLYIHPNALNHLRLVNMGSGSVKDVRAFSPLGFDPKPNAQRYEEGTPNLAGIIGLSASLSLIEDVGIHTIADKILAITSYAAERLRRKGYQIVSPEGEGQRSGILIFRHPTLSSDELVSRLDSAGIIAAPRGGGVRFAPHFYINQDDMDRAIAALP